MTVDVQTPAIIVLGPRRDALSGVSTHLNQLFASHLARDYRLVHFEVGSEGRREGGAGKLVRLLAGPLSLGACIFRQRAALVHINSSLEPRSYWRDLAFLAVAKILRCKVVYQVHGGALPDQFFAGSPLLTWSLKRVLAWPDVLVLLAKIEMEAYARFVPSQRCELVANAIDVHPYLSRSKPERSDAGPLRLVFVGRLIEAKGVFEAVDAVALLLHRGIACELDVAGSGPAEPELRRRVIERRVEGRVRFVGPVFDEAKLALWFESDVFVFPTAHREGLPYALLESMAAGTPVVATRVGGIPDVMQDGVHGLLLADRSAACVAEALIVLAADRGRLRSMSRAARTRILAGYGVDRLARELDRIYDSLLKSPSPAMVRPLGERPRR